MPKFRLVLRLKARSLEVFVMNNRLDVPSLPVLGLVVPALLWIARMHVVSHGPALRDVATRSLSSVLPNAMFDRVPLLKTTRSQDAIRDAPRP